MTVIVKNVTSFLKVPICLFGLYIISFGHAGPGGGFAGGVIIVSSYVLIMLAFGGDFVLKDLSLSVVLKLACIGMLAFAGLAIAGLCYSPTGFFWNFLHQKHPEFISSGNITLAEFFIGLIVGALLFLILFSLSAFRLDSNNKKG